MADRPNKNIDLAAWVRLYTREMISWAFHRTSDMHAAEDLVQETFLIAAEKLNSFRGESQPKTWLFGILKNKIAEYYKSRERGRPLGFNDDGTVEYFFNETGHWKSATAPQAWNEEPEHLLDNEEFLRVLNLCLEQLPSQWRRCMTMKFLEERETEIICQELEISPTNYWQILHRTKVQLRQCLDYHWFTNNEEHRQ